MTSDKKYSFNLSFILKLHVLLQHQITNKFNKDNKTYQRYMAQRLQDKTLHKIILQLLATF